MKGARGVLAHEPSKAIQSDSAQTACMTFIARRHKNCRYDCDKESFGSHATAFLVGLCFNPPNAVICEEFLILGAVYGDGRIVGRSVLDLLTFDIELNLPIRPINFSH